MIAEPELQRPEGVFNQTSPPRCDLGSLTQTPLDRFDHFPIHMHRQLAISAARTLLANRTIAAGGHARVVDPITSAGLDGVGMASQFATLGAEEKVALGVIYKSL